MNDTAGWNVLAGCFVVNSQKYLTNLGLCCIILLIAGAGSFSRSFL